MVIQSSTEPNKLTGPSGFLEMQGHVLLVDYGRIYMDENLVGHLFEDGYLRSGGAGQQEKMKPIEEVQGCAFRGIDTNGMELVLPASQPGPTGTLTYNGNVLNVVYGRISDSSHRLMGEFDDDGTIFVRDGINKVERRKLDETTQLTTVFQGTKSDGTPWSYEFVRPLYRKDKSYADNEIIRYFQEFDKLKTAQKKYVIESMNIWASSGILQVVRKSEGNCMLGNIKHGAAGVTGVRTGYVTLDKEEFDKEIVLYSKYGSSAVLTTRVKPYVEVRINLVVAHEFGHQLEFCLSQATQEQIRDLYEARLKVCNSKHPLPAEYDGLSELLLPQQVPERVFASGYSRTSKHEYWAESVAAFSVPESRAYLKQSDPAVYEILRSVVLQPERVLRRVFYDSVIELQASLMMGGESRQQLLN